MSSFYIILLLSLISFHSAFPSSLQNLPILQKIRFTGGDRMGEEYYSLGMDKNETKLLLFAARELGGEGAG